MKGGGRWKLLLEIINIVRSGASSIIEFRIVWQNVVYSILFPALLMEA